MKEKAEFVFGLLLFFEEIKGFVDAIDKNKEVPVRPEESLEVIKILDGIYQSSKSGKEVQFK